MKKNKKFLILSLVFCIGMFLFSACGGVNEKALRKTIRTSSSIGICVYPQDEKDLRHISVRKFLAAGYRIKAIDTIDSDALYPGLRSIFMRRIKARIDTEQLHKMALMSQFQLEIALKKELDRVKEEIGVDYLLYIIKDGNYYHAIGIELGTHNVIYYQTYTPDRCMRLFLLNKNFWSIVKFFSPHSDMDFVIDLFIKSLQE